jgi:hypothetical protein
MILIPEVDGFCFWLWLLSRFHTLLTHKLHRFLEVIWFREEVGWILGCVKLVAEDHVWFEDRWMVASLCDE